MLLLVMITAAALRFWQLGHAPPGLYRDEAFNGLDAVRVLEGQHALFFPANNGREPAYIYLTALFVAIFGRSALAVRLAAAVTGTLTTWITYQLATSWFGRQVGLLAAWVWAVTLWPVHLSRIGFRAILLAPLLALTFWLGTLAYRRQCNWLWFLAGLVYGAGFYTYLAVRFTPLLLLALFVYLAARGRLKALWPGWLWFGAGSAVALAPFAYLAWGQPDLLLGRTGQVSILNPIVNGGDLWGMLWQHTIRAAGMFFWRGDAILRHNPAGRPVFDLFMALPFLVGLGWCAYHWRRPAAMALLLWTAVMSGPTILAVDTPHFLRAAGLLPAIMLLPAIGLAQLWRWSRLPAGARRSLVIILAVASLVATVRDYVDYGRQPDTAYLFESAAADMARQINDETAGTAVFVDERFWSGWPAIPFLVGEQPVTRFQPETSLSLQPGQPAAIYAWPYGPLDFVPRALPPPALITAEMGRLARGDLEETAYPLYVRYTSQPPPTGWGTVANFDNQIQLLPATLTLLDEDELQVDLYWQTETAVRQEVVAFVHVIGPGGIVGQDDAPPAAGHWPRPWWQPGLIIHDRHIVYLRQPYDAAHQQILIGLYDVQTEVRLPVLDQSNEPVGDSWQLQPRGE